MPNFGQIRSKLWPFIRNKKQTDRQTDIFGTTYADTHVRCLRLRGATADHCRTVDTRHSPDQWCYVDIGKRGDCHPGPELWPTHSHYHDHCTCTYNGKPNSSPTRKDTAFNQGSRSDRPRYCVTTPIRTGH